MSLTSRGRADVISEVAAPFPQAIGEPVADVGPAQVLIAAHPPQGGLRYSARPPGMILCLLVPEHPEIACRRNRISIYCWN